MRSDADWRRYVRSRLPALNTSAEREAEVVEELAIQLATTYERAVARGAIEAEARAAAEAEVPDWSALARTIAGIERRHLPAPVPGGAAGRVAGLAADLRHAVRSMLAWRGLPPAITMLALAICASSMVWVAARSWSMPAPVALVGTDAAVIWGTNHTRGQARDVVSGPTFTDWQRRNRSFAAMAAFSQTGMAFRAGGLTDVISALAVTPQFFEVLPIVPAAGRSFAPEDADGSPVAMISHRLWRNRMGRAADVVGQSLAAFGHPHTVIGILPEDFRLFDAPDVVTLLRPRDLEAESRSFYYYWVIGRLRDGVTFDQAQQDLSAVMSALALEHAAVKGWQATVEPMRTILGEPLRVPLLVLIAAAGLVFCIGAANALNLMAAHRARLGREYAIRVSLGATPARLRQLASIENVLVAALSAAAGLALTVGALPVVQAVAPATATVAGSAVTISLPALAVDRSTAWFVLAAALATCAALSLAAPRSGALGSMPAATAATSRGLTRRRYWLLTSQAAVSTLLLAMTAILLATIMALVRTTPGFEPGRVLTMLVGGTSDLDAAARTRYYAEILRRLEGAPGVVSAALNDYVPLTNEDDYEGLEIPGHPRDASGHLPREAWRRISHTYFSTLGVPLMRGRSFTAADDERGPSVVIVNEAMARKYWGDADPIGARIRITSAAYGWSEVVGVAGNIREAGLDRPAKPMMFVPFHREPRAVMGLFVRAAGSAEGVTASVQQAVREVDGTRPIFAARAMHTIVRESYAVQRATLMVAGAIAVLALIMTMGGTYAVVALATGGRTAEIGIRMALGATRAGIAAMVLREPAGAAALGIVIGLAAAWFSQQGLRSIVSGAPALGLAGAAASAAAVALIVLAACVGPIRSASQIDPVRALRSE